MKTLLITLVLLASTAGRDWGNDPETSDWFKSLRNDDGEFCCDTTDGTRLEDPEWEERAPGEYWVLARGAWHQIKPKHVLHGKTRVKYAIVWWPFSAAEPTCFLPGPRY